MPRSIGAMTSSTLLLLLHLLLLMLRFNTSTAFALHTKLKLVDPNTVYNSSWHPLKKGAIDSGAAPRFQGTSLTSHTQPCRTRALTSWHSACRPRQYPASVGLPDNLAGAKVPHGAEGMGKELSCGA